MQGAVGRPVAQKTCAILGIGPGEAGIAAMLLHGIKIDECPATLFPEQVVPLEIAMTDALANQDREQAVQRGQLTLRRATIHVRLKTSDYIFTGAQFGNQPSGAKDRK